MDTSPELKPEIGADGLLVPSSVITLTEKVLEEKEQELRKHIQDNYSKIRDVEKELASLTLEVKLTAGPKKAALEHLRKKIELSAEKIKAAKVKEVQAKKVWEAAAKVLQDEEDNKAHLCNDLNRLVQESAAAQYTRLENLTRRLEALNPAKSGAVTSKIPAVGEPALNNSKSTSQGTIQDEARSTVHQTSNGAGPDHGVSSTCTKMGTPMGPPMRSPINHQEQASPVSFVPSLDSPGDGWRDSPGRQVSTRGRGGGGGGGRVKGTLVQPRQKPAENSWTGAGFDVHDSHT